MTCTTTRYPRYGKSLAYFYLFISNHLRVQVTQEEMLHMSKNRRKVDIREEYFVSHFSVLGNIGTDNDFSRNSVYSLVQALAL